MKQHIENLVLLISLELNPYHDEPYIHLLDRILAGEAELPEPLKKSKYFMSGFNALLECKRLELLMDFHGTKEEVDELYNAVMTWERRDEKKIEQFRQADLEEVEQMEGLEPVQRAALIYAIEFEYGNTLLHKRPNYFEEIVKNVRDHCWLFAQQWCGPQPSW